MLKKIIAVLFSLMLLSCGGESGKAVKVTSIVAIGDSIGNGFGLATPWPERIQTALNVPLNNNCVSGEQTGYGLAIIEGLLQQHKPSHVVIMLGTNDAVRGSTPVAIANLQKMVDIANQYNVKAVVGTLPPLTNTASMDRKASSISDGIRLLKGASIAEVRTAFFENSKNNDGLEFIADGVHPNNAGQQLIAEAFLAALKK